MIKKNNKFLLPFLSGIVVAILVSPFLSKLGVPTFDVVLVAMFGSGSIWAIVFSLLLITSIVLVLRKLPIKDA